MPLLFLFACQPKANAPEGEIVATYNGLGLYQEELEQFLPKGVVGEDSVRFAQQFIDEWVRAQAIQERAKSAIPGLESEINYRLKDQERKLVNHLFANWLVDNQLDTMVSMSEIQAYYDKHPDMFVSRTDYYGFYYVKTENLTPYREVTLMRSDEAEQLGELLDWCKDNAVEYHLDSTFLPVSEITRALANSAPAYQYAQHRMVYNYRTTEEGTRYYHFFKILGRIREGEPLPVSLCIGRITDVLLNQRKIDLIEETEVDLVQKAKTAGKVEIMTNP